MLQFQFDAFFFNTLTQSTEKIENLSNIEEKEDKLNKSLNIDKEKSIKKILDNDNEKNVLPISKEIKSHVITNERYNIPKVDEKKEKDKIEKIQHLL